MRHKSATPGTCALQKFTVKRLAAAVLLTAGGMLLLAAAPGDARAQDSKGFEQRGVEEIFVVAQKKGRAENIQEVPAAITAFNESQLDQLIFEDLTDLSYNIPNVQLEEVGTFPGVQNFSIRGQGINSSIPSVDPTVGVFVNGVYLGVTYGNILDTWDLESVEVLRGPQGLLFGRNVTGGAITMQTARPDTEGEFGLKARAQITNQNRYGLAAAVESPLVQGKLAAKLMAYYEDDDGYFDNVNPLGGAFGTTPTAPFVNFDPTVGAPGTAQRNAGRAETKIVRPTFVWTPTDELELTLIGELGESTGDGGIWTVVNKVLPSPPGPPGLPPAVEGGPSGSIPEFSTTSNDYGFSDIEWQNLTLEINWDVWGGTLTNIAGWRDVEQSSASDIDGSFLPGFTAAGSTNHDQFSNELRFAKTYGDFWDMTAGLYYLTQDLEYREGRYIQLNLATFVPTPDFARIGLGGDMQSDTFGAFINNDFTVAEDWTLTAGLRYSSETKDAQIISGSAGGALPLCPSVPAFDCQFDDLSGRWDNWTPKLGVRYQFTDDIQGYAFWTKGFRTGGFNFRNARPDVVPAGPTQQEEQNSYEVGVKTDLLDNRLRLNLAYFSNDIDNIQRELNLPDPFVVVLQGTINAGDVKISGVELDFTAVPIDQLTLYGSLGYLDGRYTKVNQAFAGNAPGVVPPTPLIGAELPRLAPWSFNLGGAYDISLGGFGGMSFTVDYGFRDRNFYDDSNTQLFEIQRRLRGSVNWISPEDHWTVTVFGNNIGDQANYGNLTSIAGLYTAGPMLRGKEYGLRIDYRL